MNFFIYPIANVLYLKLTYLYRPPQPATPPRKPPRVRQISYDDSLNPFADDDDDDNDDNNDLNSTTVSNPSPQKSTNPFDSDGDDDDVKSNQNEGASIASMASSEKIDDDEFNDARSESSSIREPSPLKEHSPPKERSQEKERPRVKEKPPVRERPSFKERSPKPPIRDRPDSLKERSPVKEGSPVNDAGETKYLHLIMPVFYLQNCVHHTNPTLVQRHTICNSWTQYPISYSVLFTIICCHLLANTHINQTNKAWLVVTFTTGSFGNTNFFATSFFRYFLTYNYWIS